MGWGSGASHSVCEYRHVSVGGVILYVEVDTRTAQHRCSLCLEHMLAVAIKGKLYYEKAWNGAREVKLFTFKGNEMLYHLL